MKYLLLTLCTVLGLSVAGVASASGQQDRALYCMDHPVLRADGTMGTAVDLYLGQPDVDPAYAGAVLAAADRHDAIVSWEPFVSQVDYILTCDFTPALRACLAENAGIFWGPYPVCQAVSCACDPPPPPPVAVVSVIAPPAKVSHPLPNPKKPKPKPHKK